MLDNEIKAFDRGSGDWEKLYNFMDENEFSCADFLACICASLLNNDLKFKWQNFKTEIMIQGVKFNITIEPEIFSPGKEKKNGLHK